MTADAMRRRDEESTVGHLTVLSRALRRCGPYLRDLIDVNYMEGLFHWVDVRSAKWGWRRVPDNLRELYIAFWGHISPRRLERLGSAPRAQRGL